MMSFRGVLPQRYESMTFIFLMTFFMGLVISAYAEIQTNGLSNTFVTMWLTRFITTYIVVLPTVLIVSPITKILASYLTGAKK